MKNIKFIINYAPHAAEEVASFEDILADRYIQCGIAREYVAGEEVIDVEFTEETAEGKKTKKVGE